VWISTGSPRPEDGDFKEIWKLEAQTYGWEETLLSLYDYAGQEVYLAFRYQGSLAHTWYLDDVSVYQAPGNDAGVTAITSPVSGGDLSGSESVTITLKNFGGTALSNIPVKFDVNNTNVGAEVIVPLLKPLEERTYTFTTKANLSAAASYTIRAYTALDGDVNPENNSKVISVTNSGPCAVTVFPYEDGFEKSSELGIEDFVCWTSYDTDSPFDAFSPQWKTGPLFQAYAGTLYPHSGGVLAYHEDYPSIDQDGWLVSSKISLPATGYYAFSFWMFNIYPDYYGNGKSSVWISTGSSDPASPDFKEVWSPLSVEAEWTNVSVNLANYVGKDIYVAFRYQGLDAHAWVIDDIRIALLPDNDAGVTKILSPLAGGNSTADVSVEITNFGAKELTSVKAAYRVNGKQAVEEVFSVNIESGKTGKVTFTQRVDLSAYGRYTVEAYTLLEGDVDASNDKASVSFRYIEDYRLYGYQLGFDGNASQDELNAVSFTTGDPETFSIPTTYKDGENVITAGEYFDGHLYLFSRAIVDSEWVPGNLIKLKDWTEVSKTPVTDMPEDMAYDYSTSTMYAIVVNWDNNPATCDLKTVDLSTGVTTLVAPINTRLFALACHLDGTLYGINRAGDLCAIHKETGELDIIGNTGVIPQSEPQSMAFDHTTGDLIWAAYDLYSYGELYDINPATGEMIYLGNIGGNNSDIVALHTLYPRETVKIVAPENGESIVVYPNPAKDIVHVSAVPAGSSVNILDLSGRILQSHQGLSGNVSLNLNLTNGIYFVQVKNKEMQVIRKLIVR
jgi:hypothetical protein